jgi:hypothetical protein
MKLTGENRRTREKTCPSATLSTTNPAWTDLGSNPGLRGGRPAANRLSHGTAYNSVCNILSYNVDSFWLLIYFYLIHSRLCCTYQRLTKFPRLPHIKQYYDCTHSEMF